VESNFQARHRARRFRIAFYHCHFIGGGTLDAPPVAQAAADKTAAL